MTCLICGKDIDTNGWGEHAYFNDDVANRGYIHHRCRPPDQTPDPPIRASSTPESQYLTLTDAAAVIGISTQTLRRRIKNKTLPAFRLSGGKTILIQRTDLLGLLEPIE